MSKRIVQGNDVVSPWMLLQDSNILRGKLILMRAICKEPEDNANVKKNKKREVDQ